MKSGLTTSNGVRLILVTPGSFIMGSPPDEVGHEVTLPYEFYLGATYFGCWQQATLAAGVKPKCERWSKERVIECIQDLHVKQRLRKPVVRHYPQLVDAAARYFGNWSNALVAAGVLRGKPRQNRKWSKKAIEAIREWDRACEQTGPHPVSRLLRAAAWRYFGGFPQAMCAAGLEPRRRRTPRSRRA